MGKKTPFYELHVKANAKIVDFAGWDMPLHYGSQIKEHHQVRQDAGLFDVSHMGIVDVKGTDAAPYLRHLLANNIDRLVNGKALYTCMLNHNGGIMDDLIVYKIKDDFYRIVINAGTREKDIAWMKLQASSFTVQINECTHLAMLAIQGPEIKNKIPLIFSPNETDLILNLKPFTFTMLDDWLIARTGYTGEDGYEIIFPAEKSDKLWDSLLTAGIQPCGLGARDTLRLEAGLNLYGADMDESVTPFESNLAWTVMMDAERSFIGREALEKQAKQGIERRLIGLVLKGPGIIRNHQKVFIEGDGEGEVTSGGYSPTLERSIALARVPIKEMESPCFVEIRHKQIPAQMFKPPFVRQGKKLIE